MFVKRSKKKEKKIESELNGRPKTILPTNKTNDQNRKGNRTLENLFFKNDWRGISCFNNNVPEIITNIGTLKCVSEFITLNIHQFSLP